jgi:hypothetical protein
LKGLSKGCRGPFPPVFAIAINVFCIALFTLQPSADALIGSGSLALGS